MITVPVAPDPWFTLAAMTAVPLSTAVTKPDWSTVATDALLVFQVTVAPAITSPFWSRTVALSCTVAPSAVSSNVAGFTSTVVGRGGSDNGADEVGAVPSPHAETIDHDHEAPPHHYHRLVTTQGTLHGFNDFIRERSCRSTPWTGRVTVRIRQPIERDGIQHLPAYEVRCRQDRHRRLSAVQRCSWTVH